MNTIAGAPDARAQLAALIFAVLLLDEDDRIVEANHAAEEMLGRSARKLAEKRFWDVVGIADHRLGDRLSLSDAQVIARGVTIAPLLATGAWYQQFAHAWQSGLARGHALRRRPV